MSILGPRCDLADSLGFLCTDSACAELSFLCNDSSARCGWLYQRMIPLYLEVPKNDFSVPIRDSSVPIRVPDVAYITELWFLCTDCSARCTVQYVPKHDSNNVLMRSIRYTVTDGDVDALAKSQFGCRPPLPEREIDLNSVNRISTSFLCCAPLISSCRAKS